METIKSTGIMKKFTSAADAGNVKELISDALGLKANPFEFEYIGKNRTMGLIFFNSSLRTRLSTQKAAVNLGMSVIVMNVGQDGWALETQEGVVMDQGAAEHIKEAAAVMGQYCDVLGIRSFPGLKDREEDYSEKVLNSFLKYAGVPVISLESATRHPLQSLTDLITIEELKKKDRPKVVLSWAPHPKALPHAVPNSFCEWVKKYDADFLITHPDGYELSPEFRGNSPVIHDQNEALKEADFVYVKNWSSFENYGKILSQDKDWMITKEKLALTDNAKFMHCLPVRRNVIVSDEVIDSESSVVIQQAGNRVWAAQAVLKRILANL